LAAVATAFDPASAPPRGSFSLAASILTTATGAFLVALVILGAGRDDARVVVSLPPEPGAVGRVIPYSVTVAIAEPPRQPFLPRPVERPTPIVAIAPIRDERETISAVNRGGSLSEAGADNVRSRSDRLAIAPTIRLDPANRSLARAADRIEPAATVGLTEAVAVSNRADSTPTTITAAVWPEDRRAGFAADGIAPSELDLWAVAELAEDGGKIAIGLIRADGLAVSVEILDLPATMVESVADPISIAPARTALIEPRVTDQAPPPSADALIRFEPGPAIAERSERAGSPDRIEIAAAEASWAEAARPAPASGDRWTLARSSQALFDAGGDAAVFADRTASVDPQPHLADAGNVAAPPADGLDIVPPLAFDPEDAVFVTAVLPDWSEWDDAVRQSALRERIMLRAAVWSKAPEPPERASPTPVSARSLTDLFDRHNFRLGGSAVVPALFIKRLPADLGAVAQPADRKALFLRALLPFVVAANERITRQRERLIDLLPILEQGLPLGLDDRQFLERIQSEFRVSRLDLDELLRRMDIVPPSLALAQAAEESGWGTSRPAREDNALFGQMVFHEGGMKLREFEDLRETVEAYVRNLNTHRAYADFRQKRAQQRRASRPIDSDVLVGHIERYSERGQDYIASIRHLMASNGLRNFDDARLSDIEFLVQATAR